MTLQLLPAVMVRQTWVSTQPISPLNCACADLCQTGANTAECCPEGTECKDNTGLYEPYKSCCPPDNSKPSLIVNE